MKNEFESISTDELERQLKTVTLSLRDPIWYNRVPGEVVRNYNKLEKDLQLEILKRLSKDYNGS